MNKKWLALPIVVGAVLAGQAVVGKAMTVSVVLKPSDETGLRAYAAETVDPTSTNYRNYLTPAQIGSRFGASMSTINSMKKYFHKHGLYVGAYKGRLSVKVVGAYTKVKKAFHAKRIRLKNGDTRTKVVLPKSFSNNVAAVLGAYDISTPGSKKAVTHYISNDVTSNKELDPGNDAKAFSKAYGPEKFAKQYNLNSLYDQCYQGQGQSIGLIVLKDTNLDDARTYWDQMGVNSDISRVNKHYVLGDEKGMTRWMKKGISVSEYGERGESSLDVQQAGSIAPKANINMYVGQATNQFVPTESAYYTAFSTAINANKDDVLSTSFGVRSEIDPLAGVSSTNGQLVKAFDVLWAQAAAQGISVFNASGDHGAYEVPSNKQNLGLPSGTFETEVGGTTLPIHRIMGGHVVDIKSETAWNNAYQFNQAQLLTGVIPYAGGGGFSRYVKAPVYQMGIPGVNTFTTINALQYQKKTKKYLINTNVKSKHGTSNQRAIPDISANSDVNTGYAQLVSAKVRAGKKSAQLSNWTVGGGTSYAAPQTAAAFAVLNGSLGRRIGYANPQLYRFASSTSSPLTVLDQFTDNNLSYTGQPGKIYNQATGLGTIDYTKLLASFKADLAK